VLLPSPPYAVHPPEALGNQQQVQADAEENWGCPPLFELRNAPHQTDLEGVIAKIVPNFQKLPGATGK